MVFDVVSAANKLFRTNVSSYREIIPEFSCEYRIRKENLPTVQDLMDFLSSIAEQDEIEITFDADDHICSVDKAIWLEKYEAFVEDVYDDDEVKASLLIKKHVVDGVLSVYNLKSFAEFLTNLKIENVFLNFVDLFKKCGERIVFRLLDTNGTLRTRTIALSNNNVDWKKDEDRGKLLKKCEDACVFLDRGRINLVPQDFEIEVIDGEEFEGITELFEKLERILSYIYVANTASIVNGAAVLQFDPSSNGHQFSLDQLSNNSAIPKIYDWIFREDGCVDKASIARKIINIHCHTSEDILSIDDAILNSIKSNYVIYQNDHVNQYIEMKNKISEFIVDSVSKIQELSHDIADAFRNNLIAVMVFMLTVILTDSIDFHEFMDKKVSSNVVSVCWLFTGATLAFFIITIIINGKKWGWLKQSYYGIKNNYKTILDQKDLEEEFQNDKPLKNAKKQFLGSCILISVIWIAFIALMVWFTLSLKT